MKRRLPLLVLGLLLAGCSDDLEPTPSPVPLAENVYGVLGEIRPDATSEQRAAFERGRALALRRFTPEAGLGPLFNVVFCAACHERPTTGGSAGHYRDFYLQARLLDDGTLVVDNRGGVVTSYGNGDAPARPALYGGTNLLAGRNPIPFFGVGLIAELPESAILANADPNDADGDGISGRPNFDRGFVGRFGRKAQAVSIEAFIRGPLNNHLGVTTDPLTEEQLRALPVPSGHLSAASQRTATPPLAVAEQAQSAAPSESLTDLDEVPDPELGGGDLFDLVSFTMLLAAPRPDPPSEEAQRGWSHFEELGCADCHVQALAGPRGGIPLYSDLLLHDMGEELADGIEQGVAGGSEFRTQPLWGVIAVGPYLHDGRADTLEQAVLLHGGEAQAARDGFAALGRSDRSDVMAFLGSLGGADQVSSGLLPTDAAVPEPGEPGGPMTPLREDEMALWLEGRELFDRDMAIGAGLGPFFNGDSCRACHFDPVIGGAGPADVNVIRHGAWTADGDFVAPEHGTILEKLAIPGHPRREPSRTDNVFEPRQTPTTLGLGLIESISDETIMALADPDDLDGDGIRGVAHLLDGGRLGRFGWKANIPSIREFARDALSAEIGLTVPEEDGLSFGFLNDEDDVADPEISVGDLDALVFYMANLAPPSPQESRPDGRQVFVDVGCADCHVTELEGAQGPVPLFSDLLLHTVGRDHRPGIPDGAASQDQFRTPPLWGLSQTPPYLHDGSASTVRAAIEAHGTEAESSRLAFEALEQADADALIAFLEAL